MTDIANGLSHTCSLSPAVNPQPSLHILTMSNVTMQGDIYFPLTMWPDRGGISIGSWISTLCLFSLAKRSKSVLSETPPWRTRTFSSTSVANGSQQKTSWSVLRIFFPCICESDKMFSFADLSLRQGKGDLGRGTPCISASLPWWSHIWTQSTHEDAFSDRGHGVITSYKSAYSIFVPLEYVKKERELGVSIKKFAILPLFLGREIMRYLNSILFVCLDLMVFLCESLLFSS